MDDNSTGIPKKKDLQSYELSGKVMLFSVVTLILFLLFILLFHFSRFRRRPSVPFSFCRRGLDPSTLASIPTFTYAPAAHPKLLHCAVCLSDFDAGDSGRVLPGCRHSFHVHCIDAWFKAHSTCPLCRSPVNPTPAETAIPIDQFPAVALAPVECRRKSPEPQGWFGLKRVSEPGEGGGSGSGGPESGVLDLKRLLTLEHMTG